MFSFQGFNTEVNCKVTYFAKITIIYTNIVLEIFWKKNQMLFLTHKYICWNFYHVNVEDETKKNRWCQKHLYTK